MQVYVVKTSVEREIMSLMVYGCTHRQNHNLKIPHTVLVRVHAIGVTRRGHTERLANARAIDRRRGRLSCISRVIGSDRERANPQPRLQWSSRHRENRHKYKKAPLMHAWVSLRHIAYEIYAGACLKADLAPRRRREGPGTHNDGDQGTDRREVRQ